VRELYDVFGEKTRMFLPIMKNLCTKANFSWLKVSELTAAKNNQGRPTETVAVLNASLCGGA